MGLGNDGARRRPNLSDAAQRYLDRLRFGVDDLFYHALAVLHDPAYREANAGALRMEWPRIPLPDGDSPGAADELAVSTARGRELARLLDLETPVPGVTTGELRPELAVIAVPATADGSNMTDDDFALTAGWGHFGTGDAVMPGQGHTVERCPRRHHLRHPPERQHPLEQRPRRRLELQARRLPGPQEVVVVPRDQGVGPPAAAGRGAVLHRHGKADWGDFVEDSGIVERTKDRAISSIESGEA